VVVDVNGDGDVLDSHRHSLVNIATIRSSRAMSLRSQSGSMIVGLSR